MCDQHFQQSMDQPGMVANPSSGQLNREIVFSQSPIAPENVVVPGDKKNEVIIKQVGLIAPSAIIE